MILIDHILQTIIGYMIGSIMSFLFFTLLGMQSDWLTILLVILIAIIPTRIYLEYIYYNYKSNKYEIIKFS